VEEAAAGVAAAVETAGASADLAAVVPVAVGPQAIGSRMKLIKVKLIKTEQQDRRTLK
jgi:hypothetical protein